MSDLELELEREPAPRAPDDISAVRIAGRDLDLDRVLASLTIRHGRDSVDGEIQSSTATLPLRNVTRSELVNFGVGLSLEILDRYGDAIFTGQISDLLLVDDDPASDVVLTVTASSTLALAGSRDVAGHAWPAESWTSRMQRILDEAGLPGIVQGPSPAVPLAATVPTDPEAGTFASMSALDALEADRAAIGMTAFDLGDGRICVQAFDYRSVLQPITLDADYVLYSPEWSQTLDVVNRIVLGYGYGAGTVTVDEPVSQGLYGVRWSGAFDSGLADHATAERRAFVWLDRIAYPRWAMPGLTILGRAPLEIGGRLNLYALPDSAPRETWSPVVEGWTDVIDGPDWTQEVVLSDPIFSSLALRWQDVPLAYTWQAVNPAARWTDADDLANLRP